MDERLHLKYRKILEILPDIAECAQQNLVLVGGTALALFHLKHRVSIDLDFVPVSGKDTELKEKLKGCLSKKGYRTSVGAYSNQFIMNLEETSIKVEIFIPDRKVKEIEKRQLGSAELLVASIEEILEMKKNAYANRKEARDLFDIYAITKTDGGAEAIRAALKGGRPKNTEGLKNMLGEEDYEKFKKAVADASA